jgi:Tol biopolymer transport system component
MGLSAAAVESCFASSDFCTCFDRGDYIRAIQSAPDIGHRVPRRLLIRFRRALSPGWSRDGKFIYFQTFEGVGQQLYRSPTVGGEATLMAASDTIDEPVESPDGRALYFMPHYGDTYLMRLALDSHGAVSQPVAGLPKLFSKFEWYLVPSGIYFTPQDDPRSICFYDPSSRNVREIFRTGKDPGDGLSVSRTGVTCCTRSSTTTPPT